MTTALATAAETIRRPESRTERLVLGLKVALVVGLIAVLYSGVIAALVSDWWTDPGASHGLLIPPLALYIAWMRRALTLEQAARADSWGLLVVTLACVVFLAGKLGAEFFLSRVSLIVLIAGLVLTFWGLARLKTLAFPLVLLVTMIPLPAIVYNVLASPLQLFASDVSTQVLQAFGMPVYREGNVIHLAETSLGVAEACSGLRSLSSLVVLALLVGFLQTTRLRTRVALFLAAIPIAIGVNVLRVIGTAFLADYNQELAMGFYHSFSGWLVFLGAFGLLWGLAKALRLVLDY